MKPAKIAVFDSGLGGLTVYRQLRSKLPDASYVYFADNAAFPYGEKREDELVERILALFAGLIAREAPDICVIACNTASTIALEPLRQRFAGMSFVGTVPAIKVAAQQSLTGMFSVLATPGTVRRDYTRDLVERFANGCAVNLVGAPKLAHLAEQFMRGAKVSSEELLLEIRPAFITGQNGLRTDHVVLGCTHFPLLSAQMQKVAPWPVTYIDPSAAIARQTEVVLRQQSGGESAFMPQKTADGSRDSLLFSQQQGIDERLHGFLHEVGLQQFMLADWAQKLQLPGKTEC